MARKKSKWQLQLPFLWKGLCWCVLATQGRLSGEECQSPVSWPGIGVRHPRVLSPGCWDQHGQGQAQKHSSDTMVKCMTVHRCLWGHVIRDQSSLRPYFWALIVLRRAHMDFLRINPHHAMMWQTCLLLKRSSIVITVLMGVIEDWRKGKLLEAMVIVPATSQKQRVLSGVPRRK